MLTRNPPGRLLAHSLTSLSPSVPVWKASALVSQTIKERGEDPQKTVPQETPGGQVEVEAWLGQRWLPGMVDVLSWSQ